MNYLDLLVLSLIVIFAYKGAVRGGYRSFITLLQNALALALTVLFHSRLLLLVGIMDTTLGHMFEIGISIPTGPGTAFEQAILWLRDADVPKALAEAISSAWTSQPSADIVDLSRLASQVLAKAMLNLLCFVALFIVLRWLVNILSGALVKVLPLEFHGVGRAWGLSMGIIESIVVSAVLIALLSPIAHTTIFPENLAESYRQSKLVDLFLVLLKWLGGSFYRL